MANGEGVAMGFFHHRLARLVGLCAISLIIMLRASPAVAASSPRTVKIGPIWNQIDAEKKCPDAARRAGGTWTGEWLTTKPGEMSVCEVMDWENGHTRDRWIDAGPIWNRIDAAKKCADVASRAGGAWSGEWRTTRPGEMSVCNVVEWRRGRDRDGWINAGPIWNQNDAENKCPQAAREARGIWTGEWRTTKPGETSVCEIADGRPGHNADRWVDVGPIWNQADADRKCREAALSSGGKWTGQWNTTRTGRMSVCEIMK